MAATDLADYLATKGVPFREAHEIVGKLVLVCDKSGTALQDLSLVDLRAASPRFEADALSALDIGEVVRRRTSEGGTGHDRVREQLKAAGDQLKTDTAWLQSLPEPT